MKTSRGFSLIELVVVVAIVGVLLTQGVKSYSQWIANTRIRSAAESVQNGLLMTQAEAIRRNERVQFVLTNTDPVVGNVNSVAASTSGSNWMVRVFQTGGVYTSTDFLQGRSAAEGTSGVTIAAGQSSFNYTGMGRLNPVPGAMVSINVSHAQGNRPLRVTVEQGGAVRMCDPGLSLSTSPLGC